MTNTDPRDQRGATSTEPSTSRAGMRDDGQAAGGVSHYRDEAPVAGGVSHYRDDDIGRQRDSRLDSDDIPMRKVRETKPAFLTTEFWFAIGGIAALIAVYLIEDDPSLDLFRTALLATLIGVAYIVSRGLAKAGSRTTRQPDDPRFLAAQRQI